MRQLSFEAGKSFMDTQKLKQSLEGALLAADHPLSVDQLEKLFVEGEERPTRAEVREALTSIAEDCEGRGFELKEVASGFRFQVRQALSPWVGRLWEERPPRYSRATLETLALIAYRQPITRAEIEEIRGVAVSTNIIKSMTEREWIRVVGHKDLPGKPAMYGTTRQFLDYFNLKSLDELPTLAELRDLDKIHPELGLEEVSEAEAETLVEEAAGELAIAPEEQTEESAARETHAIESDEELAEVPEAGEEVAEAFEAQEEETAEVEPDSEELAAQAQASEQESVPEPQRGEVSDDSAEDDTVESNIVALSLPKGETRH